MDYEKTLEELEDLLKRMESPDISLKQMMEDYKKALDLYSDLDNYLTSYKQEISKITKDGPVDFDVDDIEENLQDE